MRSSPSTRSCSGDIQKRSWLPASSGGTPTRSSSDRLYPYLTSTRYKRRSMSGSAPSPPRILASACRSRCLTGQRAPWGGCSRPSSTERAPARRTSATSQFECRGFDDGTAGNGNVVWRTNPVNPEGTTFSSGPQEGCQLSPVSSCANTHQIASREGTLYWFEAYYQVGDKLNGARGRRSGCRGTSRWASLLSGNFFLSRHVLLLMGSLHTACKW